MALQATGKFKLEQNDIYRARIRVHEPDQFVELHRCRAEGFDDPGSRTFSGVCSGRRWPVNGFRQAAKQR